MVTLAFEPVVEPDFVVFAELDVVCPPVLVVADALVPVLVFEPPPPLVSKTTTTITTTTIPLSSSAPPRLDTGSPEAAADTPDAVLRGARAGYQVFGQDVQLGIAGRKTAGQRGVGPVLHRVLDAPLG